jgi:thiamine monophosphate kinase
MLKRVNHESVGHWRIRLIHRIAPQFLEYVKDNVFGIGDDCAVIPQKNEKFLLVTTDLLIEDDIPVSSSLKSVCRQHNWNAIEIAATGGEDYCLLWTADPAQFNRLANAFQQQFDKPFYTIGRIEEGDTLVYY